VKVNSLLTKKYSQGRFEVFPERPELDIIHVKQEHTSIIKEYTSESLEDIVADGIITTFECLSNKALAIKTADCLPILFLGDKVALVHAGWKGLANGILDHKLLTQESWSHILIGPSIHHYEVQPDFKDNFPNSPHFSQRNKALFFNLQAEALDQLKELFPQSKIEDTRVCTWKNSRYNSYRRDKTKQRNWNIFIKD
tara:strand:- start:4180 stop:4770 length:591 start_codon:yes stop_codon:yes gene_type:complete